MPPGERKMANRRKGLGEGFERAMGNFANVDQFEGAIRISSEQSRRAKAIQIQIEIRTHTKNELAVQVASQSA